MEVHVAILDKGLRDWEIPALRPATCLEPSLLIHCFPFYCSTSYQAQDFRC